MPCTTFWKRSNASRRSRRTRHLPNWELGAALARATSNRDHFGSEPRHPDRVDKHSPGDSVVTGARDRQRPAPRVPGLIGPIIWKVGRCRGHYGELSGASGSKRSALVCVKSTAWMICYIVICPEFTRSASVSCRAGTGVACAQRSLLALGCVALGIFTQCAVVS
jgi:hypothetical protein